MNRRQTPETSGRTETAIHRSKVEAKELASFIKVKNRVSFEEIRSEFGLHEDQEVEDAILCAKACGIPIIEKSGKYEIPKGRDLVDYITRDIIKRNINKGLEKENSIEYR